MKKILHIQVYPKLSGVQRISLEIMKALPNEEFQKFILFANEPNNGNKLALESEFKKANVTILYSNNLVRELNLKKDFNAFKEIYKLCKQEHFDIVHTHSSKPGVVGRIASFIAKTPLVIHTVHGISFTKFTPPLKYLFYYFCEIFSTFFCHKLVLVNRYYKRFYRIFAKKTVTIYNALDFHNWNSVLLHNDTKLINLLYVGRLDTQKDPITLLKGFNEAIKTIKNIHLTIVGDGELYSDCQSFINNNGIEKFVTLEGWQTNTEKYYRKSDIFVSSSIYEAFGLMFLEASYCKLPIIATDVEGIPEVVLDGKTGLLYKPRDYHSLASNIIKLSTDKDLRDNLGKNAASWVQENFQIKNMTNEYIKIYNMEDKYE